MAVCFQDMFLMILYLSTFFKISRSVYPKKSYMIFTCMDALNMGYGVSKRGIESKPVPAEERVVSLFFHLYVKPPLWNRQYIPHSSACIHSEYIHSILCPRVETADYISSVAFISYRAYLRLYYYPQYKFFYLCRDANLCIIFNFRSKVHMHYNRVRHLPVASAYSRNFVATRRRTIVKDSLPRIRL